MYNSDSCPLFAGVLLGSLKTLIASHVTTPTEFTMALINSVHLVGVISPSAAQQITPVHPLCPVPIALPAERAQWSLGQVLITVIRRMFPIDQFQSFGGLHSFLGVWLSTTAPFVHQSQLISPTIIRSNETRFIVLPHESVADNPKRRKSPPTRLHRTGTRYTVTLAVGAK